MNYCEHCINKARFSLLLLLCTAVLLVSSQSAVPVDNLLIEGPEGNASAPLGFSITLTCRGNGTIVWMINGTQIRSADNTIGLLSERNVFPQVMMENVSNLTITASMENNRTTYACRIEAGEVFQGNLRFQTGEESLFINYGLPGDPTNIGVVASGLLFVISWEAPFLHRGEVVTFQVEATTDGSGDPLVLAAPSSPFEFNGTLGERDCSEYRFTVNTKNAVGLSPGGIVGRLAVPTTPNQLLSSQVSISVSLDPLSATLTFPPPDPCPEYPVTHYLVMFRAYRDSSDLISPPSEQVRNLPPVLVTNGPSDTVMLDNSESNLPANRFVIVEIMAVSTVGTTTSEDISFSTGGVQSATVVITDDYIGNVTCLYATGIVSGGCQVSLTQVDSNGTMTFLFNVNTTVDEPSVGGIVFQEVPDGSSIVASVRDLSGDGSTGSIETAALVQGPFTPTTQPPVTTAVDTTASTVATEPSTEAPSNIVITEELLYIIVGAGGGAILLLLVGIICITCCICCCTRRKKSDYAAVHKPSDDLSNNHAYGDVQLTGATSNNRPRNNTYIENTENGELAISGLGPAYETIEDAKKAAIDAGASLASNPIYATAIPPGSETNLAAGVSHSTLATGASHNTLATIGSQANLVANPVYADTNNTQTNGKPSPYSDVSAMNPIYSGVGTAPPPIQIPTNPRPPGFPYKSESSPLSPSTQPSPNAQMSPTQINGYSTPINRSQSTDIVPSFTEYAYAEVRGAVAMRPRNAVSTSSDQEKPAPFMRNESYGLLASSTSPTSPPASVPEDGSLV